MTEKAFYYFHHDLSKKDKGGIEPIYTGKNLLNLLWWTFIHTDYDNYVDIEPGVQDDINKAVRETKEFKDFYESELQLRCIKQELKKYNIKFAYATDKELERYNAEFGYETSEEHKGKMLIGIAPTDEENYVRGYLKFIEDISSDDTRFGIYHRLIKSEKTMLPIERINYIKNLTKKNLR
ncbi:Uncharacterized protein BN963_SGAL_00398 [Streptococcus gallolyticus]|uniref:Uncharacterized protein n=1 Tax=Streptococcus gallolyticus TaxID=315405 RepID=A0A060RJS9_9STRE|nr:hypothetical protein [Streptococcus gallolyticus]MCF1634144.1 hypothetical protein [Streptococcus gallolyticus]CDO17218.1 Uncharacterized protein BN963_SGAL_00398 [Streptococcus gallolyticus]